MFAVKKEQRQDHQSNDPAQGDYGRLPLHL